MIIQAYWVNQFISTLFIYCCKMFSNLLTFLFHMNTASFLSIPIHFVYHTVE